MYGLMWSRSSYLFPCHHRIHGNIRRMWPATFAGKIRGVVGVFGKIAERRQSDQLLVVEGNKGGRE